MPADVKRSWTGAEADPDGPRQGFDPKVHTDGSMMQGAPLHKLLACGSAPGVH